MKKISFIFSIIALLIISSCTSIKNTSTLAKCNFNFNNVGNVQLCGIAFNDMKSAKSLNAANLGKLLTAFATGKFPLTLDVNLDVKNPNSQLAKLAGADYKVFIDNVQMIEGQLDKAIEVPANSTSQIAIPVGLDLKEILKGQSRDKLIDFACNLSTTNEAASRVKVSIKPYFTIGNSVIKYPGYITIGGDKIMPQN